MADKTGEQLSALMDGECGALEAELALRRLAKDNDLQARWQRYVLISEALKNGLPESIDTRFSGRLRDVIDGELPSSPSVDLEPPSIGRRPLILAGPKLWYKPAAGFALAASVALIVVIGVDSGQPTRVDAGTGGPELSSTAVGSIAAGPRRAEIQSATPSGVNVNSRLNNYVVNHNEYLSTNSVHGMLPYVRMVGYEPTR
jgi:sigma-E factor negative regulatory protein RseA